MSIGPPPQSDPLDDAAYWLGRPMTRFDAERVRKLRRDEDKTWREVARDFFPDDRWDGNQIAGMELHVAAMKILGETWE